MTDRRGFLALLAGAAGALALKPLELAYARTLQATPEVATFEGLNACLKHIYPAGCFEEALSQRSAFYRHMKGELP